MAMTFCKTCERITHHLLKSCTSHSDVVPGKPRQLFKRPTYKVDMNELPDPSRPLTPSERRQLHEDEMRWRSFNNASHHGKKVTRRKLILPDEYKGHHLCQRCWHPMELITSSFAKVASFRVMQVVREEDRILPSREVMTVEYISRRMYPHYQSIRICPKCVEVMTHYVQKEQQAWHDKGEDGPFRPSFTLIHDKPEYGLSTPRTGIESPPSNLRSGKWKTWKKI